MCSLSGTKKNILLESILGKGEWLCFLVLDDMRLYECLDFFLSELQNFSQEQQTCMTMHEVNPLVGLHLFQEWHLHIPLRLEVMEGQRWNETVSGMVPKVGLKT